MSDNIIRRKLRKEYKPMKKTLKNETGIELLKKKYQKMLRIPENLWYYAEPDFRAAEKKFIKWALGGGESNREQLLKLYSTSNDRRMDHSVFSS